MGHKPFCRVSRRTESLKARKLSQTPTPALPGCFSLAPAGEVEFREEWGSPGGTLPYSAGVSPPVQEGQPLGTGREDSEPGAVPTDSAGPAAGRMYLSSGLGSLPASSPAGRHQTLMRRLAH